MRLLGVGRFFWGGYDVSTALLTVPEAAELLRLNRFTIYDLTRKGVLPIIRIGSAVRIHPDDLAAFIAARRSSAAPVAVG